MIAEDSRAVSYLKAAGGAVWWTVRNPKRALMLPFVAALAMDVSNHVVHTLDLDSVRYGHTATAHQIAEGYR